MLKPVSSFVLIRHISNWVKCWKALYNKTCYKHMIKNYWYNLFNISEIKNSLITNYKLFIMLAAPNNKNNRNLLTSLHMGKSAEFFAKSSHSIKWLRWTRPRCIVASCHCWSDGNGGAENLPAPSGAACPAAGGVASHRAWTNTERWLALLPVVTLNHHLILTTLFTPC